MLKKLFKLIKKNGKVLIRPWVDLKRKFYGFRINIKF